VPDTDFSCPLSERDSRKQLLKLEISKCMRQLDLNENTHPNNVTMLTEGCQPQSGLLPVGLFSAGGTVTGQSAATKTTHSEHDTTSMSNLLLKYQQKRNSSSYSRQAEAAHQCYLNQLFSNNLTA